MTLKHQGQDVHSFECTGPSLKKGRHRLAIGLLRKMYGDDKRWHDLMQEMDRDIIEAREKRGAGPKPVVSKYDPNYLVEGQEKTAVTSELSPFEQVNQVEPETIEID